MEYNNNIAAKKSIINMHGIVDLDQMGSILTTLMTQVEQQNRIIESLQKDLGNTVTKKQLDEFTMSINNYFSQVNSRIDSLQASSVVQVSNKKLSVRDLAVSNWEQLSKLSQTVSYCISRKEVETQYQNLMEIKVVNDKVKKDLDKTLQVTDYLSKSQLNINNRLTGIESSLSCKIDRSEVSHLESVAAKIDLYEDFKNNTIKGLEMLNKVKSEIILTLEEHDQSITLLDDHINKINNDISKTATKKDTHQIAKEIEKINKLLALTATSDKVDLLENVLNKANENIDFSMKRTSLIDSNISDINSQLLLKATIKEVRECVTRKHYEEAVTALGNEIELKSSNIVANNLNNKINEIEDKLKSETERISVAMRFVDWFTNRGENYEHNMKIIDKHLKNLAINKADPTNQNQLKFNHNY